jgi:hypothetical protein
MQKALAGLVTVLAIACGGDDSDDSEGHLRPATESECPGGGSVLERDHGRKDIVCEGEVSEPSPEETCESIEKDIMTALGNYIRGGALSSDTLACGADGLASGIGTFHASYTEEQRNTVISEFANACDLLDDCD